MDEAIYRVPAEDRCPTCNGTTRAVYYRVKGLVPFVYCTAHGQVRLLTREEHRKNMMSVKKEKGDER